MKIVIIGAGAYAVALSSVFDENNCDVTIWTKFEEEYNNIINNERRIKSLNNYQIPKSIKITTNIKEALEDKDLIVIAVPAGAVDEVSKLIKLYITHDQHVCIASKGIEQGTCLFVSDVFSKYNDTDKLAIISGGGFAIDIIKKVPIGLSLASKNKETIDIVKKTLQNNYLKLRETEDIIGIEICGSIKNVIAIAAGMINGMGYPESTQAMFITEAIHDIKEVIGAFGGNERTILSFAGFSDILLTCTSKKSRNFTLGRIIGEKKSKKEIDTYKKNTTVEGLYTLESIYKLLNDKTIDMPIVDLIYDIVFNDKNPEELIVYLNTKA